MPYYKTDNEWKEARSVTNIGDDFERFLEHNNELVFTLSELIEFFTGNARNNDAYDEYLPSDLSIDEYTSRNKKEVHKLIVYCVEFDLSHRDDLEIRHNEKTNETLITYLRE